MCDDISLRQPALRIDGARRVQITQRNPLIGDKIHFLVGTWSKKGHKRGAASEKYPGTSAPVDSTSTRD